MRAAVLEQVGTPLSIQEIELEGPHDGEVRVQVQHCSVCHSDLHLVSGDMPPFTPVVLGHEAAGTVIEVGTGVTSLAVGDHVVLSPCPPCGSCYWCVRGEWSVCVNADALYTSTHLDGGTRLSRKGEVVWRGLGVAAFAEETVITEEGAIKIDDDIPLGLACVLGCAVQTGVGAVLNTAKVEEGATVAVLGLGGVGLSVVQGARLAAASRIIVSDPVAERREVALRLGATDVLDPTETANVAAAIHDLTGVGADYVFDAVGSSALVNTAINGARKGGAAVMVGVPGIADVLTLDSATVFAAQQKRLLGCLLGSVNSRLEIPRLLALWKAGRLDLEAMVTGHRSFDDINGALDDTRNAVGVRTVVDIAG